MGLPYVSIFPSDMSMWQMGVVRKNENQVLTTRALRRVSHGTQDATDTKMATGMNVGRIKASLLLNCPCNTRIIRLCQDLFDQSFVCHSIDNPRNKVSFQAVWSGHVHCEVGRREWPVHYTSSTGVACNVQGILGRSSCDGRAVATKTCVWIEDL